MAETPDSLTLPELLQRAAASHRGGDLAAAEPLYRAVLQREPAQPDANHNLGVLLVQTERVKDGLPHFEAALGAKSSVPQYWLSYLDALLRDGQLQLALRVLQLGREQWGLSGGGVDALAARLDAQVRAGVPQQPATPAVAWPAGATTPQRQMEALVTCFQQGQFARAQALARVFVAAHPKQALGWKVLGATLHHGGHNQQALEPLRMAASLEPRDADAHTILGVVLTILGRLEEAADSHTRALQINPSHADALNNLGLTLFDLGRFAEAEQKFRQALHIKPRVAGIHSNLGKTLANLGRFDAAEAAFAEAIRLEPDFARAHSGLLFTLNYHPNKSAEAIYAAYARFDDQFGTPYRAAWRAHGNDASPGRRLKVGYVSPDFRLHSTRHFLEPLLAHHGKDQFEVHAYADLANEDAVTQRYMGYVDRWTSTGNLTDDALAERIRADGIDILVDIAGHTAGNRLAVFARKPAPVSVSWLGFGYTTGLKAMDYFLTDAASAPAGSEALFSEVPWRLDGPFLAYRPAPEMGDVGSLPAAGRGHVSFVTLTRSLRVNPHTVRVWSHILHELPTARLIIDSGDFRDPAMQTALLAQFQQHGIAAERIAIGHHSPPWDLLRQADVMLDCFPHNSGTTLLEGLYMGLPLVTLASRPSVGRLGESLLRALGRPEWIATTEDGYIQCAVALASDFPKLATLRSGLRQAMQRSALMDEPGFAISVESAYRAMWQRWCAQAGH